MITDKEINQVADDEKQKDWNELRYADIYKDAFVDGAKWARSKVSRVELPVRREIYDRLLYYCWCVRFEKDEDFMLTKTHDAYKEFLTQTETHDGDCTLQAVSCMRCHLQACEIEAQKLYNYLCGK